jgi:hypothetical protein
VVDRCFIWMMGFSIGNGFGLRCSGLASSCGPRVVVAEAQRSRTRHLALSLTDLHAAAHANKLITNPADARTVITHAHTHTLLITHTRSHDRACNHIRAHGLDARRGVQDGGDERAPGRWHNIQYSRKANVREYSIMYSNTFRECSIKRSMAGLHCSPHFALALRSCHESSGVYRPHAPARRLASIAYRRPLACCTHCATLGPAISPPTVPTCRTLSHRLEHLAFADKTETCLLMQDAAEG